jgi:hypothetical protein
LARGRESQRSHIAAPVPFDPSLPSARRFTSCDCQPPTATTTAAQLPVLYATDPLRSFRQPHTYTSNSSPIPKGRRPLHRTQLRRCATHPSLRPASCCSRDCTAATVRARYTDSAAQSARPPACLPAAATAALPAGCHIHPGSSHQQPSSSLFPFPSSQLQRQPRTSPAPTHVLSRSTSTRRNPPQPQEGEDTGFTLLHALTCIRSTSLAAPDSTAPSCTPAAAAAAAAIPAALTSLDPQHPLRTPLSRWREPANHRWPIPPASHYISLSRPPLNPAGLQKATLVQPSHLRTALLLAVHNASRHAH